MQPNDRAEAQVAALVGTTYSGHEEIRPEPGLSVVAADKSAVNDSEAEKYEFDEDFQTAIAIHAVRDADFMRKVGHLIDPRHFENAGEAAVVNLALKFWGKYQQLPTPVVAKGLLKEDIVNKVVRGDVKAAAVEAFKAIFSSSADLGNGDFFADQVATFARHQAMGNAILASVDDLQARRFDKIEDRIKAAGMVGISHDGEEYNYWETITERTNYRKDKLAGITPPTGVTTGLPQLDDLLYHRGWGKKEVTGLVGGPKVGKTAALINFAKNASLAGEPTLYVTLEVSKDIVSTRADASVAELLMKEIGKKPNEVDAKVKALATKAAQLQVHQYPSGTFTPSMLRALLERYKSPALRPDGTTRPPIKFGLVVVDYADLMRLDHPTNDSQENSRLLWVELRAIADIYDVAILTATALNRDGIRATVAHMTHIGDDINKVRTADLLISINATDEEKAAGEARLHFMASRNQETGITVHILQDLQRMKFIQKILKVE